MPLIVTGLNLWHGWFTAPATVLLLVVALPPAAHSGDGDASPKRTISSLNSFDHHIALYRNARAAGDAERTGRFLVEIRRLRAERNVFQLHDTALFFVAEGVQHFASGQLFDAETSLRLAMELDPTLPIAYWEMARVAREKGSLGFLSSLGYCFKGFLASFRSLVNRGFALVNLVLGVFITLFITMFVVAGVMLYRYGALIKHDVYERLGDRMSATGVLAVTLTVFLMPIMVTAGLGWLAPYWLAVTFGYQSLGERVFSVVSILAIISMTPFIELHSRWSRMIVNPLYESSASSINGTFDPHDISILQDGISRFPMDRELKFLLATQYKNIGDYERSASVYRNMLLDSSDDLDARINLGNIYFAQSDWKGALTEYNQALDSNPNLAMVHYNKSLVFAENFQFEEREKARREAERLNVDQVNVHERQTGNYRVVADNLIESAAIRAKFDGLQVGLYDRPAQMNIFGFVAGKGVRFLTVGLFLAGLILFLEGLFRGRNLTQRCLKCGSAFCGRCQIGAGRSVCPVLSPLLYEAWCISARTK